MRRLELVRDKNPCARAYRQGDKVIQTRAPFELMHVSFRKLTSVRGGAIAGRAVSSC